MGLRDKLTQVVERARKLRQSRDPESYARYERNRDSKRKRAEHEHEARQDSADRAREQAERTQDFEDRYAAEHEPKERPDSS